MTGVETPLWAAIRCEDAESSTMAFTASGKIPCIDKLVAEINGLNFWMSEPLANTDLKPGEDIVIYCVRKKGAPSWTNIARSVLELVNKHKQAHEISQLEWQSTMPECMLLMLDRPPSLPYDS